MPEREEIRLPKEDQETLEGLATDVDWLERELTRAERAGLDVKDARERFNQAKNLRQNVLREYGE